MRVKETEYTLFPFMKFKFSFFVTCKDPLIFYLTLMSYVKFLKHEL